MVKQTAIKRVGDDTPGPGRRRGGENRTSKSGKQIVLALLTKNEIQAQAQMDALKRRPLDWLRIYVRLASLVIPRQHHDDAGSASTSLNINIAAGPIVDKGDAARVYAAICGRPDLNLSGLHFGALEHQGTPDTPLAPAPEPEDA